MAQSAPSIMKRLLQAPNLALATLWADQLQAAGIRASVQHVFTSSIAGELPPDQCLPAVWLHDDAQHDLALALLHAWRQAPWRHCACAACGETVDGPFDRCWNCAAPLPPV
jgi:hypothetical protein